MKSIFYTVIILGTLSLTSCSSMKLAGGSAAIASDTASVAALNALPNNGMCVTLRMNDTTQQLIYLRVHPQVQRLPQQTIVSTPLTTIIFESQDVVYSQLGKALMAGTSAAGLPTAVTAVDNMNERMFFFGLPKGSHINIQTEEGLQWRDQDIEGSTFALVLTELPRGKYLVSMNSINFHVELK